jgi:hypothetical protein
MNVVNVILVIGIVIFVLASMLRDKNSPLKVFKKGKKEIKTNVSNDEEEKEEDIKLEILSNLLHEMNKVADEPSTLIKNQVKENKENTTIKRITEKYRSIVLDLDVGYCRYDLINDNIIFSSDIFNGLLENNSIDLFDNNFEPSIEDVKKEVENYKNYKAHNVTLLNTVLTLKPHDNADPIYLHLKYNGIFDNIHNGEICYIDIYIEDITAFTILNK